LITQSTVQIYSEEQDSEGKRKQQQIIDDIPTAKDHPRLGKPQLSRSLPFLLAPTGKIP
jgi:hypothetical protein